VAWASVLVGALSLTAFALIDTPPALEFFGVIAAVVLLSAGVALVFERRSTSPTS
jgi:hypothetical protein